MEKEREREDKKGERKIERTRERKKKRERKRIQRSRENKNGLGFENFKTRKKKKI
jgi:hypothetical protein